MGNMILTVVKYRISLSLEAEGIAQQLIQLNVQVLWKGQKEVPWHNCLQEGVPHACQL